MASSDRGDERDLPSGHGEGQADGAGRGGRCRRGGERGGREEGRRSSRSGGGGGGGAQRRRLFDFDVDGDGRFFGFFGINIFFFPAPHPAVPRHRPRRPHHRRRGRGRRPLARLAPLGHRRRALCRPQLCRLRDAQGPAPPVQRPARREAAGRRREARVRRRGGHDGPDRGLPSRRRQAADADERLGRRQRAARRRQGPRGALLGHDRLLPEDGGGGGRQGAVQGAVAQLHQGGAVDRDRVRELRAAEGGDGGAAADQLLKWKERERCGGGGEGERGRGFFGEKKILALFFFSFPFFLATMRACRGGGVLNSGWERESGVLREG